MSKDLTYDPALNPQGCRKPTLRELFPDVPTLGDPEPVLDDAVNKVWCARYDGPPVNDISQLVTRVEKLAEDRDCWLANAKSNQREYLRMEKRVKELEAANKVLRMGISAHVQAADPSPLVDELAEYISR